MADAVPVTLKDGAPVVEPEVDTVESWEAVGDALADNTADTDGDGEAECEVDGEKLVAALRLAACDGEVVAVPESDVVGDADASVVGDA